MRMHRVVPLLYLVVTFVAACSRARETSPSSRPALGPSAAAGASAVAVTGSDGSATQSKPDAATSGSANASERDGVDLLHWTRAEVVLSSNVANPRDYPQHLVDNKPETAWNSKTDDLVGAYISFAVPKETHVKRIDLSAGFDKSGPKGDYFAMNHRIKKVRVFSLGNTEKKWDGSEGGIGDFTLDPNERRPQQIPVDKPGGVFVIRVLEVVPGTKKEWRELTVSELRVMGDPGPVRLSHARMPDVGVGGYATPVKEAPTPSADDPDPTDQLPIVGSSIADACARWDKIATPIFAKKCSVDVYPGPPEPPHCRPGPTVAVKDAKVKSVRTVELTTVEDVETHVMIETDRGVVIPRDARLTLQSRSYQMRTESSAKVMAARVEGGDLVALVAVTDRFEFYSGPSSPDGPPEPTRAYRATSEFDLRCGLDAKPMTCTRQARKYSCTGPDCPEVSIDPR